MTTLTRHDNNLYLTDLSLPDFDVRGAVVLGENHALVWDTLTCPDDMAAVTEVCGNRNITVVYSHADWDHVWGTDALTYQDVVAHKKCAARFADPEDVAATLTAYQAKDESYEAVALVPPTRTFEDELVLELGDLAIELHALPGHTSDCIVAFLPHGGILLAGDTVETPLPVVPENPALDVWIAKLKTWHQDARVKTVIPSHGKVGGRELIGQTLAYLEALRGGNSFDLPETLDAFYDQTHAANQKHVAARS